MVHHIIEIPKRSAGFVGLGWFVGSYFDAGEKPFHGYDGCDWRGTAVVYLASLNFEEAAAHTYNQTYAERCCIGRTI